MLPIALIGKGAMRTLDVSNAEGISLPVVGRDHNSFMAWCVLVWAYEDAGFPTSQAFKDYLWDIVSGEAAAAETRATQLIASGVVRGSRVFDPAHLPNVVADLTVDLARGFLLAILIPVPSTDTRQLIKFSFHWPVERIPLSWTQRLHTALGYAAADIKLDVNGAAGCGSYHLEVHAPAGLTCEGLVLPKAAGADLSGNDTTRDPVAHAYGSYPEQPPSEPAVLSIGVPRAGLRFMATLVVLFTAAVFLLEQLLPGGQRALLEAPDGAVAILLAAPAVVLALLAQPGENAIAAQLLWPVRCIVLGCSLLLTAGAASLVGHLHQPFLSALWILGGLLTTVIAIVMWKAPSRAVGGEG
jgi:hypothetical protein